MLPWFNFRWMKFCREFISKTVRREGGSGNYFLLIRDILVGLSSFWGQAKNELYICVKNGCWHRVTPLACSCHSPLYGTSWLIFLMCSCCSVRLCSASLQMAYLVKGKPLLWCFCLCLSSTQGTGHQLALSGSIEQGWIFTGNSPGRRHKV